MIEQGYVVAIPVNDEKPVFRFCGLRDGQILKVKIEGGTHLVFTLIDAFSTMEFTVHLHIPKIQQYVPKEMQPVMLDDVLESLQVVCKTATFGMRYGRSGIMGNTYRHFGTETGRFSNKPKDDRGETIH